MKDRGAKVAYAIKGALSLKQRGRVRRTSATTFQLAAAALKDRLSTILKRLVKAAPWNFFAQIGR